MAQAQAFDSFVKLLVRELPIQILVTIRFVCEATESRGERKRYVKVNDLRMREGNGWKETVGRGEYV